MEKGLNQPDVQARNDEVSVTSRDQGEDSAGTTSDPTPVPRTECPYHAQLFKDPLRQSVLPGVHPSQRLDYTPLCDLPVGMSSHCNVGTSTSAGCTCAYDPNAPKDEIAHELEAILQEENLKRKNPA
jgi:hypothetical protein